MSVGTLPFHSRTVIGTPAVGQDVTQVLAEKYWELELCASRCAPNIVITIILILMCQLLAILDWDMTCSWISGALRLQIYFLHFTCTCGPTNSFRLSFCSHAGDEIKDASTCLTKALIFLAALPFTLNFVFFYRISSLRWSGDLSWYSIRDFQFCVWISHRLVPSLPLLSSFVTSMLVRQQTCRQVSVPLPTCCTW